MIVLDFNEIPNSSPEEQKEHIAFHELFIFFPLTEFQRFCTCHVLLSYTHNAIWGLLLRLAHSRYAIANIGVGHCFGQYGSPALRGGSDPTRAAT